MIKLYYGTDEPGLHGKVLLKEGTLEEVQDYMWAEIKKSKYANGYARYTQFEDYTWVDFGSHTYFFYIYHNEPKEVKTLSFEDVVGEVHVVYDATEEKRMKEIIEMILYDIQIMTDNLTDDLVRANAGCYYDKIQKIAHELNTHARQAQVLKENKNHKLVLDIMENYGYRLLD